MKIRLWTATLTVFVVAYAILEFWFFVVDRITTMTWNAFPIFHI